MTPLPWDASDEQILRFVDERAALMEAANYHAAYDHTDHDPGIGSTPDRLRQAIKEYSEAAPDQHVTVSGVPTDIKQRKAISRWPVSDNNSVGNMWYGLNINGKFSDLTATFYLVNS